MLLLARDPEKKVKQLIKKLTHSGELELDKTNLHELKYICKCKSDEEKFIIHVYDECMDNLRKNHSQIRVAALKLLDYLFRKTHVFRRKLLDDFDLFLRLTVAISESSKEKLKLPPPKKYSLILQESTAKVIHQWHADFGQGYDKLRYAYRYLKEHRLIDFDQFRVHSHEDQLKQKLDAEKHERILTRNIGKQIDVFTDIKAETEELIVQIESLIEILLPEVDTLGASTSSSSAFNKLPLLNGQANMIEELGLDEPESQLHGITSNSLGRNIEIAFESQVNIKVSKDNKSVVENLKELRKQLSSCKIPKLTLIVKTLSKKADEFVVVLKEAIDLKCKAMNTVLKISDLKIIEEDDTPNLNVSSSQNDDNSDDDDDFVEVPEKQDIESYIPKSLRAEYGLMRLESTNNDEEKQGINFDGAIFIGEEVDVLCCRVKLETGKLCPRRDKLKCPFHGKIVPRDSSGLPINKVLRQKELDKMKEQKPKDGRPEWQDPKLLRDLEAAIGIDLTLPQYVDKKKKKSLEKKLENIRTCDKTAKQRLQKRIKLLAK